MTISPSGIYKITNLTNNKIYVGQSQNVFERKIEHFTALRRKKHPNKQMQKDWNKNNRGFRWDVIEFVSIDKLNEREKYWIDTLNSAEPNGYNGPWVPYRRGDKRPKRRQKRYHKTR